MLDKSHSLSIGIVGPFPPPFGGMANQAKQLVELLRNENIKVEFVQNNAPYQPAVVGRIKGLRAFFRIIPFFFKVWDLSKTVDVVHVFSNSGWAWQLFSAPVIWVGWIRKKPVIVNYRGGEARQYLSKSIHWVSPTLRRVAKIIVPSGYLQKIFSEFNFESEIIPNIINLDRFTPKENSQFQYRLMVARNLESIYGIDSAIRAVKYLKKTYPQVRLYVAGSGPQEKQLLSLVKELDLEGNIKFVGKITPDEMVALFHSSDIMLNPSLVDNMPNAILESMACGVPVVTTNAGGIPYITENNVTALLVEIGQPEAMANAVLKLYQDKNLYNTLAKNGIEEVKKYSWHEVKHQWIDLYHQLSNKK